MALSLLIQHPSRDRELAILDQLLQTLFNRAKQPMASAA
jgi:hypothetical protein